MTSFAVYMLLPGFALGHLLPAGAAQTAAGPVASWPTRCEQRVRTPQYSSVQEHQKNEQACSTGLAASSERAWAACAARPCAAAAGMDTRRWWAALSSGSRPNWRAPFGSHALQLPPLVAIDMRPFRR